MRVLLTGANGFVGQAVRNRLVAAGMEIVAATRRPSADTVGVGNIDGSTDWRDPVHGCDAVIHLAARVHVMRDTAHDPLAEFRRVNVEGTSALVRQAADAGVKRFIFMSSLKVNGEERELGYCEQDPPDPREAYGVSKREAEQAIEEIASRRGLEWVILRPPLVYGPGVGANFLRLARLVASGVPLPFEGLQNRRSMIYVHNLADLVQRCLVSRRAVGEVFLAHDGSTFSLPELVRRMASAMNRPARLFAAPQFALAAIARLAGRQSEWRRLAGSLFIESSKVNDYLDWSPPVSSAEALSVTVGAFERRATGETS